MAAQSEHVSPIQVFVGPAPEAIWIGPQQSAALEHLAAKTRLRVLIGPPSSGKSTILQHYQRTVEEAVVLPISGPQSAATGVLATLLVAAKLRPSGPDEIGRRNLLTTFMRQRSSESKRIILCVDNIAGFAPEAWQEIERLRLVTLANRFFVELAVVGTESETEHAPLGELVHESTTSAIEAVHFLSAPTDEDAGRYIEWWLSKFGLTKRFSAGACQLINRLALGRYSLINILCQLTLKQHRHRLAENIDTDVVRKAAVALATRENKAAAAAAAPKAAVRAEPKRAITAARPVEKQSRQLVVSCNGAKVREVELGGRLMIGSAEDSDLRLQSPLVDRHHALITATPDGGYHLADLHSTQGVLVNERAMSHCALRDGDVVRVGPFSVNVELHGAPSDQEIVPEAKPSHKAPQRGA